MVPGNILALEYFSGGIPPRVIFEFDIQGLNKLVDSSAVYKTDDIRPSLIPEVCLVSLASYFEAFCKNQFASIINICPQVLDNFIAKRETANLKLKDVLKISEMMEYRMGSLLVKEYAFSSPQMINTLYNDLLRVNPFSDAEANRYNDFLEDTHLLIHHGGVFTNNHRRHKIQKQSNDGTYFNSFDINKDEFNEWSKFIEGMADKITFVSYKALKRYIVENRISLAEATSKAIELLSECNLAEHNANGAP